LGSVLDLSSVGHLGIHGTCKFHNTLVIVLFQKEKIHGHNNIHASTDVSDDISLVLTNRVVLWWQRNWHATDHSLTFGRSESNPKW
jgi:hypothetical protein